MAGNNTSGQDSRQPGAREYYFNQNTPVTSKSDPTSAGYKRKKLRSSALSEDPGSGTSFVTSHVTSMIGKKTDSSSKKGKRTQFTPNQVYQLEQLFRENNFPGSKEREKIAKELQISAKHVQVWFQNHRAKHRRKEKRKEATKKALVTLKPPSFWPANVPFDSSISSASTKQITSKSDDITEDIGAESIDKDSETLSSTTGSVTGRGRSSSPSLSTVSGDLSGSALDQSSSSPIKLSAYPLSPSSPLPTPHAPSRKRSSSFGPISPVATSHSNTPSPPVQPKLAETRNSPTSTTTTGPESSQVYVEDPNAPYMMDTSDPTQSFQMPEFSPPIFAQSPVYLLDILNDPDIASILTDPLHSAQEISVTGILPSPTEVEYGTPFPPNPPSLPHHPTQHTIRPPIFYQNPETAVGYGSSHARPNFQSIQRPHHPPFLVSRFPPPPPPLMIPASEPTSLNQSMIRSQLPHFSNQSMQPLIQQRHSSISSLPPSLSELFQSNSPLVESSSAPFLYNTPPAYTSTLSQRLPPRHTPYLPPIHAQDMSYMSTLRQPSRPIHFYPTLPTIPPQSLHPQSLQGQQAQHSTFPPPSINYPPPTLPSATQQNHPHHQHR